LTVISRLLLVLVSLPLLGLALYAVTYSANHAIVYSSIALLEGVAKHSSPDAQQAISVLETGAARAPLVASVRSSLSDFHTTQKDYASAQSVIEEAIALRLTWPYDWMRLAELYAAQNIFDERMSVAIDNVERYGGAERVLTYRKAVFAMRSWYGLDEGQREALNPSIMAVLSSGRAAQRFFFDVERYQRSALFCRQFRGEVSFGDMWCSVYEERQRARLK